MATDSVEITLNIEPNLKQNADELLQTCLVYSYSVFLHQVTFRIRTAFYNTDLKERYKGG